MGSKDKLDKFGQFIVENLRDRGIDCGEKLLNSFWNAPAYQEIQVELSKLSDYQREIVKQAIIASFDSATHDFLFAIQSQEDIEVLVEGDNIMELTDWLHGQPYADDGWYARFSKYKNIE